MNAERFRRMALAFGGATEGAHMGHPDFRVNGRIFATIHPGRRHGTVKLDPDQQRQILGAHANGFAPESGAWGRQGYTRVMFDAAEEEAVGEAMTLAWQNTAAHPARARRTARPKSKQSLQKKRTTRRS